MFWCTCFGTKTLRNMNGLDLKKIYFVLGLTYSLKWTNCSKKTHQRKCLTDEREREKKKIQLLYPVFINTIPEWRKGQRLKTLTKIWPFLIISPIELRRSPSLPQKVKPEFAWNAKLLFCPPLLSTAFYSAFTECLQMGLQ